MKVSIIITCYNLQHFIKDAVQSLLDQRCDFNFEIILIDDASTDGSRAVIESIRDPRLHTIFLEKNVGAASAINIAFEKCTGEYLCRFDGDDKWHPDYLRKAAAVLDQNAAAVLVHTDVAFIDENHNITSERNNIPRPRSLKPVDNEFKHILGGYYICAPAIMARKSNWDKVMPWGERFRGGLGDWFISLQMLEQNLSAFIDEPLAYYRIHSTNMHRAMIKNGIAEKNTYWILDYFRKRSNGVSPTEWRTIYFRQNKSLGFAYFFHDMMRDARRCLLRALKFKPSTITNTEFTRILFASFVGKKFYNKAKDVLLAKKNQAQPG